MENLLKKTAVRLWGYPPLYRIAVSSTDKNAINNKEQLTASSQ